MLRKVSELQRAVAGPLVADRFDDELLGVELPTASMLSV